MKIKHKIIALVTCAVLTLSLGMGLSGCSSSGNGAGNESEEEDDTVYPYYFYVEGYTSGKQLWENGIKLPGTLQNLDSVYYIYDENKSLVKTGLCSELPYIGVIYTNLIDGGWMFVIGGEYVDQYEVVNYLSNFSPDKIIGERSGRFYPILNENACLDHRL